MAGDDDELDGLREALRLSPDNAPLRRSVVRSLVRAGRLAEAETALREALQRAPGDESWQLALADVFERLGRRSEAWAIFESLTEKDGASAAAHLAFARALAASGDIDAGARHYRRAIARDAAVRDDALAARLGVPPGDDADGPGPRRAAVAGDEVVEPGSDPRGSPAAELERPKTTFQDVGGMETVKDEIRMKILHPLQHPDLYRAYGKTAGGGILMYGPPGCGKTHLARATAGEVKAGFLSVGIADVLDMWFGQSEQKLHELFEQARRNAPCVLFFDEVDALGGNRADARGSGGRHLVNLFLSEMDGLGASNDGVLILAATNTPWHIDPAFRRPGRFDRVLFVPPPDEPARAAILEAMLRDKPKGKIDFAKLGRAAKDLSGADLKGAVDVCIEAKLREAMKKGAPSPIVTADLERAIGQVRPTTKEWFATARNYALYANQGGLYDDVIRYMKLT